MSGIGTGYDLSCTSYSPDGKIFQIDYAGKAVDSSGTAIGVRVKDGIVLGVEKLVISKMLEPTSNKRILPVDRHVGACFGGLSADAKCLVNRARTEAKNYKSFYQDIIPAKILSDRVAGFVQAYTLYGHLRPFGVSLILGAWDADGPQLYMIEPSGLSYGYYGTAVGKAKQAAKGELEKLKLTEMTVVQATKEIARIIYSLHDEIKDKDFELEMSWICEASGYQHAWVPKDVLEEAKQHGIDAKNAAEMDENASSITNNQIID